MLSFSKRNKLGSIVLETAIVMSAVLVLLTVSLTSMNVHNTEIIMQAAIEQSVEDISGILPFTRVGAEGINLLTSDEQMGPEAVEAYNELTKLSAHINDLAGMSVEELLADRVLGGVIRNDIAANFAARSEGMISYVPDSIRVELCYNEEKNCIEEIVSFKVSSIFGDISRNEYAVIPFYGIYSSAINTVTELPQADMNPWDLNNLERGQYFEEAYGSNLPHLYPVISSYNDGNCGSVLSIDLTGSSYSSPQKIEKVVKGELEDLSSFNGADVNIRGERYSISPSDIKSKTLTVVIAMLYLM